MQARWVLQLAVATWICLVVACSPAPTQGPARVAWGARVPEPAPEAVPAQTVVARGPNSITLLPISPTGATVGVAYGYDMPHCGINSPIDVDGSFWDAVGIPRDAVEFDGAQGSFRLLTGNTAQFTRSDGRVLQLVRHAGPKAFPYCD
jgi:hypothetical protein